MSDFAMQGNYTHILPLMLLTLPPSFRSLLGHLQSIVFMVYKDNDDGEYYFQFCEGIDAVRLGINTRIISNTPLSRIFTPVNYEAIEKHFRTLLEFGGTCSFEMQYAESYFLVNTSFVGNGNNAGDIIGNMVDITMIKRAEEELRNALEQEKSLVAMKTQFMNTVSHEFRTPLTGIQISATMLQRYNSKMDDDHRVLAINQINKRIHELTTLMDTLLLQSSTKTLKELYSPIETDLNHLLHNIICDYEETMDCAGHSLRLMTKQELHTEKSIVASVDPRLLKYAIRNLLSNAVKYSPNEKYVDVFIEYSMSECTIHIKDYGIGMDKEECSQIFTPFFRSQKVENISGTGLGLNIAHEFILIHNGYISVESAIGCGSTFSIHLPIINSSQYTELIHTPEYRISF